MLLYRNIAANYFGRAWLMAATYIFVPVYIALLGAESYALIAFYAVLLTFASLADVGLSTTFSREAARVDDPAELVDVLASMERLLLCTTLLIGTALLAAAPLVADVWLNDVRQIERSAVVASLQLMALTILPQMAMAFYSAGLMGLQRQVSNNVVQSIYIAVRSGLVVPLLWWQPDPILFFGWQLATTIAFAIVSRMLLLRAMGQPPLTLGRYSFTRIRPLLSFAGGMILISVISSINTQLDKLVVSAWFSVSDFGHYAAASTLAQLPLALTMPLIIAFYPKLTELLARHEIASARHLYNRFSTFVAGLAGLLAAGLGLFAPEIVSLWLPGESLPSALPYVISVLALGSLFYSLSLAPYYLGLASGETRIILLLAILTLFMTAPLSYFSVRLFGLVGAALPWAFLNVVNFVMIGLTIHRRVWRNGELLWFCYSVGLPACAGVGLMVICRMAANAMSLNALSACALAGTAAICVLLLFSRLFITRQSANGLASPEHFF